MNSIFKADEDLNCCGKIMPFLTQDRVFKISLMSLTFDSVMLATWMDPKTQTKYI